MPGKKSQITPEDKKVEEELKKNEAEPQYEVDEVEGENWKKCFADILNKRFLDGWKFVSVMRIGTNQKKHDAPNIYHILYERILSTVLL